jgi:hypothetical protein
VTAFDPDLFAPENIASMVLRNSVLRSATHESLADADGAPTEAIERLYAAIITGYAGVLQECRSSLSNMLMLHEDSHLPPNDRFSPAALFSCQDIGFMSVVGFLFHTVRIFWRSRIASFKFSTTSTRRILHEA